MSVVEPERTSPLDEQLCFALYAASRAMTSVYRPMLDALELTYPQFLVLLVLWERGSVPVTVTVTGIGQALQLETGTLSPLLKRLESAGLITRTRQTGDERSVLVGLTPAGRALESSAATVQERVEETTGMNTGSRDALRASLSSLAGSLRAEAG